MWWLIWALLLLVSGIYLAMRGWGLWGHVRELAGELVSAGHRLDQVQGQLDLLGKRARSTEELAIFTGPVTARIKRNRAKADSATARRLRRATSHPAWAKHVD